MINFTFSETITYEQWLKIRERVTKSDRRVGFKEYKIGVFDGDMPIATAALVDMGTFQGLRVT